MAYIEPLVMVYQEYSITTKSTETATLPPCIVGPCYQIVDPKEDYALALYKENGFIKNYTRDEGIGDTSTAFIPNVVAGGKVDENYVSFRLSDARVQLSYYNNVDSPIQNVWAADKSSTIAKNKEYTFDLSSSSTLTAGDKAVLANVAVGDYFIFYEKGDATANPVIADNKFDKYTHRVVSVSNSEDNLVITLSNALDVPSTVTDWSKINIHIQREFSEILIPSNAAISSGETSSCSCTSSVDTESKTFKLTDILYTIDDGTFPVISGTLYVGYRALRTDVSSVDVAYDTDEVESKLGKISPDNPLAYGVMIALANTTIGVYFCGVDSDDLAGYTEAKGRLENYSPLYGIVPLTFDKGVLSMFSLHATEMSTPEEGKWRVAFGCTKLVDSINVVEGTDEYDLEGRPEMGSAGLITFTDRTANNPKFIESGIDAGDYLVLQYTVTDKTIKVNKTDAGGLSEKNVTMTAQNRYSWFLDNYDNAVAAGDSSKGEYILEFRFAIDSVPTDTILYVDPTYAIDKVLDCTVTYDNDTTLIADTASPIFKVLASGSTTEYKRVKYHVERELSSKDEQANYIASASTAYGNKRFVNIFPDVCVIDDKEQPGYYLGCAVAGAVGGLEPHYGLTRLSIAGISAVKHSSDYFNKTQLNKIADGGTFIFMQLSPSAAPYIRHQLTTDRSAIEFQELSFVKNFDYVCYICRDVLDDYIGKWNVNDGTIRSIGISLTSVMENLRQQTSPKIGSVINGYTIKSIAQSESSRDRIEAYVDVSFPYPLNTIGLHIVSV